MENMVRADDGLKLMVKADDSLWFIVDESTLTVERL
jgi:hypothetical protein